MARGFRHLAETQSNKKAGHVYEGGKGRPQVCADQRLLACLAEQRQGSLRGWLGLYTWLSLIGPQLGMKITETVNH